MPAFDHRELFDTWYSNTPLGGALRACEVFCIADCCGMNAFDVRIENLQRWADEVTGVEVDRARAHVEEILETLKKAPSSFRFLDAEHTNREVTEWFEKIRIALAALKPGS